MTRPVSSVAGLTCALAVAPIDAGHRFLHDEVDRRRQLDAHRLRLVELDADDRVRHQVVHRVAERLGRDVGLLVARRVHEVVVVAVAVEILHLALVERRALDIFFRPELLVGEHLRPDVAHPHLDVRPLVAGRQMVELEDAEEVVAHLDEHALPQSRRLYG